MLGDMIAVLPKSFVCVNLTDERLHILRFLVNPAVATIFFQCLFTDHFSSSLNHGMWVEIFSDSLFGSLLHCL